MKFVCYTDWQQLPASANALFAQGEKRSIFYSRAWLESVSRCAAAKGESLVLACVVAESRMLALLPLLRSGPKQCAALRHPYTTHFSLLLADDPSQQVLACLARGLSQMPLRALLLEPVARNDRRINDLQHHLAEAGFECSWLFRLYNWVCQTGGQSAVEYMASRPTRLRNTIARKQRKLEREHGYRIRLYGGEDVVSAMPDYHTVYRASWKAREQHVEFLDRIVREFSRRGWARLGVLYIKEQAVAAQLWFVCQHRASIFRLAYDEAWRQYSPGSILTRFLMQHIIETDKVREIDFLTGNDSYKQDWMSERRERFALSCINRTKTTGRHGKFIEILRDILKNRR